MAFALDDFARDSQGRTFADVISAAPRALEAAIAVMWRPDALRRMQDSEEHHERPALAGVVKEIEAQAAVKDFLSRRPRRASARYRQAVGVLCRIRMEQAGWCKTGRKGALGVSRWFSKAERYIPKA